MKKFYGIIIVIALCIFFTACSHEARKVKNSSVSDGISSSSAVSSDTNSTVSSSASEVVTSQTTQSSSSKTVAGTSSASIAISTVPSTPPKVYVNVTIPPGYCIAQIAQKLQSNGVCSEADFLAQVNSYPFTESSASQIPYDPNTICYRLEGYLYPDTYQFYQNMKAQDAIGVMLRGADNHIGSNYSYSGMTSYQIVTLASIIEKEAPDLANMEKVSAVFHNRLNDSKDFPYLQSEATRNYLKVYLNSIDASLVDKYKNYYNTNRVDGQDRRKGLPTGPICSPSSNALYAATHPDNDDYFYFASDGSGNYTFSHDLINTSSGSGG
jgi:UPF0755 protein